MEVFILPSNVHLGTFKISRHNFVDTTPEQNKIIWDTVLVPLFFTFKQVFQPVSAVNGCRDIGLESLVRNGVLKQKRNEFLKTIIWFGK